MRQYCFAYWRLHKTTDIRVVKICVESFKNVFEFFISYSPALLTVYSLEGCSKTVNLFFRKPFHNHLQVKHKSDI